MVREQKYLFFLCSLFSAFTPGSFFCLIRRRVGRKDRKLVSITCLQGLSCSNSPSRLAFVGSLWGWEAVEYLQNSSSIWQEQERNCRQRSVGLSRKQKCSELALIHRSAAWPQPGDCGDSGPGGCLHPNHVPAAVWGESDTYERMVTSPLGRHIMVLRKWCPISDSSSPANRLSQVN